MRTLLICHDGAALDREGLVRWLGSFSTVAGTVVIREPAARRRRRIVREIKRVGLARFLDVLAFRFHYALTTARADKDWEQRELERLRTRFPVRPDAPEIVVESELAKPLNPTVAIVPVLLAVRFIVPSPPTPVMAPVPLMLPPPLSDVTPLNCTFPRPLTEPAMTTDGAL